jgi:hypothetical protein
MPRLANSLDHLAWLSGHLTPRDRWLIRMFFEHKVFTTHQIVDLAFPSARAANHRLLNLTQWGVLHRFRPHRDLGSHPMHYVLDRAGAAVLAHEEGIDPRALKYNRDREIGRAYSLQLAHTIGCNTLFTTLVDRVRRGQTAGELTTWWSAGRCGRQWGDIVTPDGYGCWHEDDRAVEWFVEFDCGTEQLSRLTAKVHRYEQLAQHTGITTPVLFWFPGPRREANARQLLADTLGGLDQPGTVPIATTCPTAAPHAFDMTEPRWLPISQAGNGRLRLAELPSRSPAQLVSGEETPPTPSRMIDAPRPVPPAPTKRN